MPEHTSNQVVHARRAPRRGRRSAVVGGLALALVLGACGSEDLGGKVVKDGLGCQITEQDRRTDAPEIDAGLKIGETTSTKDLDAAPKKACAADAEQYLTLDLVGATAADGTVFNTTFGEDRPITTRLGQGQLITGLETGLTGMEVGARREIRVPAAEAYGETGDEALGIGKDADLVFVVDLIAVSTSPIWCNAAANIPEGTREGKPTAVEMPLEAPTKDVVTTVLEPSEGAEATKASYLTVEYLGVSCGTGQQFDSSWDREEPITIALVDAEPTETAFSVIPGWSEGLVGQKEGSTVQVDIPFEQAYGSQGQPPTIGPSDPLTFIVKIVKVAEEAPPAPTTTTVAGDTTTTTVAG